MQLQQAVKKVFLQLSESLHGISDSTYIEPCANLNNSTIGQHVRHIIEMFQCLDTGYDCGIINYENRRRDPIIETNKSIALNLLTEIGDAVQRPEKSLTLEGVYDEALFDPIQITTNYSREVIYNLEHTVHHMALIRVGLKELSSQELPDSFGVAAATIKHKKVCAQ